VGDARGEEGGCQVQCGGSLCARGECALRTSDLPGFSWGMRVVKKGDARFSVGDRYALGGSTRCEQVTCQVSRGG
jgi:hypothetical protein